MYVISTANQKSNILSKYKANQTNIKTKSSASRTSNKKKYLNKYTKILNILFGKFPVHLLNYWQYTSISVMKTNLYE